LYAIFFNGIMTEEEFIQCMLPSVKLENKYGIKFSSAAPTEVPSMNWGLSTILKGAGIDHITRGGYDLNNKNINNREKYPLFYWEGPDGSKVLTKFDVYKDTVSFGGYGEAVNLRRGTYEDRLEFIGEAIERYEAYENYHFDAIMLMGTGWDEYPFNSEIIDFTNWFNNQEWEYPKLVDSTWSDYWKHIEEQIANGTEVPVLKGDWGSSWEEWPAQLAYTNALYRKAREVVLAAQSVSAAAFLLSGKVDEVREKSIYECFLNLNKYCDHNIGGILPAEAYDTRDRKIQYIYNALKKGFSALEGSLTEITESIYNDKDAIMVFNPLPWEREGTISVVMDLIKEYKVIDLATGGEIPCQMETKGVHPEYYLTFVERKLPAFGFKLYNIIAVGDIVENNFQDEVSNIIENEYFKLEIDEVSGGITSLFDKRLVKELVDFKSPNKLNQFIYTSEQQVYSLNSVRVSAGHSGKCSRSIVVEGSTFRSTLRTTYTLYSGIERIDIHNHLTKEPSEELQTCHFVFPFEVSDRVYHFDGTAATLNPGLVKYGGDQLPGAGMGSYSGIHFADVSNMQYGITLTSIDSHLYHFGSNTMGRTEGFIDPNNSTIYSLVMENYNNMDCCSKQGGQDVFDFRYSITPYKGAFQASKSLKLSKSICNQLEPRNLRKKTDGIIKSPLMSLLDISAENITTSGIKVAEDGSGIIVRLRECDGMDTLVSVSTQVCRILGAVQTDLLEREKEKIEINNNCVEIKVPAYGIVSIKLQTSKFLERS